MILFALFDNIINKTVQNHLISSKNVQIIFIQEFRNLHLNLVVKDEVKDYSQRSTVQRCSMSQPRSART